LDKRLRLCVHILFCCGLLYNFKIKSQFIFRKYKNFVKYVEILTLTKVFLYTMTMFFHQNLK